MKRFNCIILIGLCLMAVGWQSCRNEDAGCLIGSRTKISEDAVRLSSLIEVTQVVPLQTSDSSVTGDWGKIQKFGKQFYVSVNRNTLLVFDESGKYLRKIGRQGDGPDAYGQLDDFDVCDSGIYIVSDRRILHYSASGTFLRSLELQEHLKGLKVLGDRMLGFATMNEHLCHVYDLEGHHLSEFQQASAVAWTDKPVYFVPYKGKVCIMQLACSNDLLLYDADDNTASRAQLVALPEVLTWQEAEQLSEADGIIPDFREYKYIVGSLNSNDSHLFFGTVRNGPDDAFWVRKLRRRSGKAYRFDKMVNDVTFTPVRTFFTGATQSRHSFLAYVSPGQLKAGVAAARPTDSPYYAAMKSLADSLPDRGNFVLIEYRFK